MSDRTVEVKCQDCKHVFKIRVTEGKSYITHCPNCTSTVAVNGRSTQDEDLSSLEVFVDRKQPPKVLYTEELQYLRGAVSENRYRWLTSMVHTEDTAKVHTAIGYIMALRDCGANIGNLKLYLEEILQELYATCKS